MQKYLCFLLLLLFINCSNAFVVYENTKIWDQESITFYFLDGTEKQKNEVKQFAKLWEKYIGIKFKYSDEKPSIFNFNKYYKITFKGPSNQSTQGAVSGIIHFGSLSDHLVYRKATILHEFGHMLGLGHEHQRQDRPASLDSYQLIYACMKNQEQSKAWCEENLSTKNAQEVFIESEYDAKSIMHYRLNNIVTDNIDLLKTLPDTDFNTLSYTDKYYISMLYNQNISDQRLMKMHQHDLSEQRKFEAREKIQRESAIMQLKTSSCKPLKYPRYSKDGKFCKEGFMIIGRDDISFPGEEFKVCHLSLETITEKMQRHAYCHLTAAQLTRKRKFWSQKFLQYGQCKRLETNEKNKQEYFCKEGYSFVTHNNDMIGSTTQCFSSYDSVYKAMQESPVCNMNKQEFRMYEKQREKSVTKSMSTLRCRIVKKDYSKITCPTGYKFSIINRNNPSTPLNNKCFSSRFQAINAMEKIQSCQN